MLQKEEEFTFLKLAAGLVHAVLLLYTAARKREVLTANYIPI